MCVLHASVYVDRVNLLNKLTLNGIFLMKYNILQTKRTKTKIIWILLFSNIMTTVSSDQHTVVFTPHANNVNRGFSGSCNSANSGNTSTAPPNINMNVLYSSPGGKKESFMCRMDFGKEFEGSSLT